MTSRDFCYWLMGYFEITGNTGLGEKQSEIVKRHLDVVFKHEIDPSYGTPEQVKALGKIHSTFDINDTKVRC